MANCNATTVLPLHVSVKMCDRESIKLHVTFFSFSTTDVYATAIKWFHQLKVIQNNFHCRTVKHVHCVKSQSFLYS